MSSLFQRFRAAGAPRRNQPPGRVKVRLAVEPLEERAVPATFQVTTDKDTVDANTGFLSLRQAIIAANAQPGPDTIVISPNLHDLNLINGELLITSPVTIQGSGANTVQINQSGKGARVFNVQNGLSQSPISVQLIGVTVTGGNGVAGAGVYNNGADLTLVSDVIAGNNSGGFNGGGVLSDTRTSGSLTVIGSSIVNNSTATGTTGGSGAGIQIAGPGSIQNSTIANNNAGNGSGGGINAFSVSTIAIQNSTIANNNAFAGGGLNIQTTASVTLQSTLISGNASNDLAGSPTATSSYNLINVVAPNVTGISNGSNHNLIGTQFSANLASLAVLPGSKVPTLSLTAGSSAIDAGSNPANLTSDQNGNPRQIGPAVDIGAVEAPQSVEQGGGSSGGGGSGSGSGSSSQQSLAAQNAALVQAIVLYVLTQPKSGIQLLALTDLNGDGFVDIVLSAGSGRSRTIVAINGVTGTALFMAPAPVG